MRTKDPREARRLLPGFQSDFHAECDAKRRPLAALPSTARNHLSADDFRRLAQEFYQWELDQDAGDRLGGNGHPSTRRFLHEIGAVPLNEELVRQALAMGTEEGRVQVMDYADVIAAREGLPREGPLYDQLCQALLRAKVEAHQRGRERDAGDFSGMPRDELLTAPVVAPGGSGGAGGVGIVGGAGDAPGATLAVLCRDYLSERRDVSLEWQRAIKSALEEFQEAFGGDRPAAAVTRKDVANYKAGLLKLPAHALRRADRPSFAELVRRGRADGERGLANGSINRRLSALSKFGAWALDHGHVEQNVFGGLGLDKKQASPRRPFSVEQLRRVFSSPLFVGCASDGRGDEARPGSALIEDWRYWCMPLALFSGLRLGEILQLRVEDVVSVGGIPCVRINAWAEEGGQASGKHVKTADSWRYVALHPTIIALGFLDYVQHQRVAGSARVFSGLKADNLGRETTEPSKFLNRYLTRIGVKLGPGLVYHSFRHTLVDGMRTAGHPDAVIAAVVGHDKGDGLHVTRGYGEKARVPVLDPGAKAKIIASVIFEGLDLSHLNHDARKKATASSQAAPAARERRSRMPS